MRFFVQQALSLAQRFTHQADFAVFQVAQPAVDDPGGTTRCTGGEVMLLGDQDRLTGASAFTRNGRPIDAAADHNNFELFSVETGSMHLSFDATADAKD
jgi:hypothetical protein